MTAVVVPANVAIMLSAQSNAALIQRAAAISLHSARVIVRSIETVRRSVELARSVARECERISVARTERLRSRAQPGPPATEQAQVRQTAHVPALPLTPPRLLELADEFRSCADTAATWEERVAMQDLVFRYTALAAGYDTQRVGSRMLH
jgi:hypothetical protein